MSYRFNPYKVGDWVEGQDFYGRKVLLEQLWGQSNRITHLLGMRRIGKTSVLKQLAGWGKAVYFDLMRTGFDWNDFNLALRQAIWRERQQFPWLTDWEIVQNSANVCELLETLDDAANQAGARVWLLFDEAELLIALGRKNIAALQMFHSVIRSMRAVQVVFASAKELTELDALTALGWHGSPFLNHFPPPIYLSGLDDEAAVALIRQTQNDFPLPVADDVVQAICQCTNKHPYFIQWVCYHLWNKNPNAKTWRVEDVIGITASPPQQILKKDFDYLSDPERHLIRAILTKQPFKPIHHLYLEGLTALGYLRQVEAEYEIANDFFKNWLLDLANQDWTEASNIAAEPTLRLYKKSKKRLK